mgnify:CR=1 FL=1
MRPIYWGIIFFIIGALGWVTSVVFAVVTLGKFKLLANIFGYIFLTSLPAALLGELVGWIAKRRK